MTGTCRASRVDRFDDCAMVLKVKDMRYNPAIETVWLNESFLHKDHRNMAVLKRDDNFRDIFKQAQILWRSIC